jgi:pimeloyl-ACP methyl ester carboxylesterase
MRRSLSRPSAKPALARSELGDDLRGLAALTIDGVQGVLGIVEAMHQNIAALPSPVARSVKPAKWMPSKVVYRSIAGITRWVAGVLDSGLALGTPLLPSNLHGEQRDAFLAALNGVLGDHLRARSNGLAIPMQLCANGVVLADAKIMRAAKRPLLMLHGLCMNDHQWRREGHNHGEQLAQQFGFEPFYLRYNTGRAIAENGAELAVLLETQLGRKNSELRNTELRILAHSMGGLLARSAWAYAHAHKMRWPRHLRAVYCLGTPHSGAFLERAGTWVDQIVGFSPYSAPLMRIGGLRSQGIKDLRNGKITYSTADDNGTAEAAKELATKLILIAGRSKRAGRLATDGLVSVSSALGQHRKPAKNLAVAPEQKSMISECNHFELLSDPRVLAQLVDAIQNEQK